METVNSHRELVATEVGVLQGSAVAQAAGQHAQPVAGHIEQRQARECSQRLGQLLQQAFVFQCLVCNVIADGRCSSSPAAGWTPAGAARARQAR